MQKTILLFMHISPQFTIPLPSSTFLHIYIFNIIIYIIVTWIIKKVYLNIDPTSRLFLENKDHHCDGNNAIVQNC